MIDMSKLRSARTNSGFLTALESREEDASAPILLIDGNNQSKRLFSVSVNPRGWKAPEELLTRLALIDVADRTSENLEYVEITSAIRTNYYEAVSRAFKSLYIHAIIDYIRKFRPNKVVLGFDPKVSWRHKVYPEYKAGRADKQKKYSKDLLGGPVDWSVWRVAHDEIIEFFKSTLKMIRTICVDGAEYDDLVYALVTKYPDRNFLNISNDKDFYQLFRNKNYTQFNPLKREMVTGRDAEFDLNMKLILGDDSDNIPQIKRGVGPVTAEKMISGGTLDEFFKLNPESKVQFDKNVELIDMRQIPKDVVRDCENAYENLQIGPNDRIGFVYFCSQHGLNSVRERENEIFELLRRLN